MAELDPLAFQKSFQASQSMFDQQRQNKLQDLLMGQKVREIENENKLASAYSSAYAQDGTLDRNKLRSGLAGAGLGHKIPAVETQFLQQDKAQREADKARLDGIKQKVEIQGQLLGSVRDEASYQQALKLAQANGIDVSELPQQYDPNFITQARHRAMSAAQQIEQEWKQKGYDQKEREFAYRQENDAAGRNVTMRGQDMTDVRARDLNATRAEEARIKREQKDDINNQTKASQLASFDTMLGTLDRLSQHPGLENSVGWVGMLPTRPGSNSANFQAELNTFQSQAFLPMVAQLKGMGALSDAEGKKLTAAVGALDPKMGEDAFRASIKRITDDMQAARNRMVGGAKRITDKAAYDALPSGTVFVAPDGSTRRKP